MAQKVQVTLNCQAKLKAQRSCCDSPLELFLLIFVEILEFVASRSCVLLLCFIVFFFFNLPVLVDKHSGYSQ